MNTQNNQYLDDYVEKYRYIKEKWLKDFNKSHGTTSKFCKEHCIHGLFPEETLIHTAQT